MSKISTNISLDPQLKKEAIELFNSFGLDLSTAITLFLSQSVREQRIPFEISAAPFYSTANIERLQKSIKDAQNGKLTVHELIEVEDE